MKISVKVKPGSNNSEFDEKLGVVYLKERAEKGKANFALIKLLKKHFKCNQVKIIKGLKSKQKTVEIC